MKKKITRLCFVNNFLNISVLQPVNSTEDMDNAVQASYLLSNQSATAFYIGLFFRNTDGDTVPDELVYDLRLPKYWRTEDLYPYLQIPGPRNFCK